MGHFPFFLINLKFQGVILSKFDIAISVVNGPFFCSMCWRPIPPHYPNHCIEFFPPMYNISHNSTNLWWVIQCWWNNFYNIQGAAENIVKMTGRMLPKHPAQRLTNRKVELKCKSKISNIFIHLSMSPCWSHSKINFTLFKFGQNPGGKHPVV